MKSFVVELARGAGKILMKNYGKVKFVKSKEGNSYFTNVDLESEKFIISRIRERFPNHDIVSEEAGRLNKKCDYRWFIDPLDGTHNYIRNIPLFGVSIGMEFKGNIVTGVIYLPYFNELYVAE